MHGTNGDGFVAVIRSSDQNHIDIRICQHGFFCFIYKKALLLRFFSLFFLDVIDTTDYSFRNIGKDLRMPSAHAAISDQSVNYFVFPHFTPPYIIITTLLFTLCPVTRFAMYRIYTNRINLCEQLSTILCFLRSGKILLTVPEQLFFHF